MDKDEPEEGEIQDDGSLEDVSSDEDTLPNCYAKISETSGDKYPVSHIVQEDFVAHPSRVRKRRVRKARKRKSESFTSTAEGSKPRLIVKYREETNRTSNDVYNVTLNPVVVDDHRRDDNLVNMTSECKPIRPKHSDKDEDIVQEKENRHDCLKETKIKRKCRRKRRHSDNKIDSDVGSLQVGPEQEGRKEDTLTKLGTKSKCSHPKKRHVSPKRDKHRYSKKRDGRKCWSRRLSDAGQKDCFNGVEGNSLLKRLQQMMTVNVSDNRGRTAVGTVKRKDEEHVGSQKLEEGLKVNLLQPPDGVKLGNENNEGTTEVAGILKQGNESYLSSQTSEDVIVLHDIKKPEPLVITIEDSDNETQVSVDDSSGKVNNEAELRTMKGEASTQGADEDEDLVQLRLLALQSNRRKVTSKPAVEDDEVMQLRLAALKSAYLKKCEVRKQRGAALKSNKINTLNSPAESGQETQKPKMNSVEALQNEPDETTTLVDMELSHTDDESNAQNDIITDPVPAVEPLPDDSAGTHLHVMHEDYSVQNVPCNNESLLTVHESEHVDLKHNQEEHDAVSTWKTTSALYRSPELTKFDIEGCEMSRMYGTNVQIPQVGYSDCQLPFALPLPQQQLHNELYESNNSSDLAGGDLDGACSDPVVSSFDSPLSPALSSSYVPSNSNSQNIIPDMVLGSRIEQQALGANSFVSIIEYDSITSKAESLAANKDPHVAIQRTETETQQTESVACTQFCTVDSTTVSYQNWNRNMKMHVSPGKSVPFKSLSFGAPQKTSGIVEDPCMISSASIKTFSPSLNSQNEVKRTKAYTLYQSHDNFSVTTGEIMEHKSDCNVEESSSELENIDLSNMIVLDEVGRCSSPEAKVEVVSNEQVMSKNEDISQHNNQNSVNMDEDEEILRAKVLTTLVRKLCTSAASFVIEPESIKDNEVPGPSEMSSMEHSKTNATLLCVLPNVTVPSCNEEFVHKTVVSHGEEGMPAKLTASFDTLEGGSKTTLRMPINNVEHSQHNLSSYSEENAIRQKCSKKSAKKEFPRINLKQNPSHTKLVKKAAAAVSSDSQSTAAGLMTNLVHCRVNGKPIPRVISCPRAPRPATLKVTVPADSVHDEEQRRKIAGSHVSSVASVLPPLPPPQRFVINLGEDSDSADEDGRMQQWPSQAPKRKYVITKHFSVPVQAQAPITARIASHDHLVNCTSNVLSPSMPQLPHPVSDEHTVASDPAQPAQNSRIQADFEKSVDIFLKQARKTQEARAKRVVTPKRCVGVRANPVTSSITPLAVRHLPSSRQEEYHRLKKQIAELEEQRKRSQWQQQLAKNMSSTKSVSLPSCPGQSAAASGSIKAPLKIVLTNTSTEKREVLQSSLTSANVGNDAGATVKIIRQYPAGHVPEFKDTKAIVDIQVASTVAPGVVETAVNKRCSNPCSVEEVLLRATQTDARTTHSAESITVVSKQQQERTVMETKNLDSIVREEEDAPIDLQEPSPVKDDIHNECYVNKEPRCKYVCMSMEGINFNESLEKKEIKLAEIEHQLLSKRYEVVDDLTSMATLLHQIERERTAEEDCVSELRRTQEALRRIEERLAQQKESLSNMRNDISESHRRVAQGRAECISLSKNCLSLGVSVKGRLYKVPAGGAELMNLKLQQVAAQTRRMSKKKECLEDSDDNPSGSDATTDTCLQIPGQDKAGIRTACSVVKGSEDTQVSYKPCASTTLAVNAESEIVAVPCTEQADKVDSKMDTSQSKCMDTSEVLGFKLSQLSPTSPRPLSSSVENVTALKSGRCVLSLKDPEVETVQDEVSVPPVTNVKRAVMCLSEGLERTVLGMDRGSKEAAVERIAEYRSPLEHFQSKRGDSEVRDGWSGPLDPLAILCPYELMGICQDEECSYQHHTKITAT